MKKKTIVTIIAVLVVLLSAAFFNRAKIRSAYDDWQKGNLPGATPYGQVQKKIAFVNGSVETVDIIPLEADLQMPAAKSQPPAQQSLPDEINLDVPFVAQAPYAVWDAIHEDTCEEASAIMAAHFVLKKTIPDAAYAEKEILKMINWENKNFGFSKDTNAEKTAGMIRGVYGLKNVEVKYDITLDDIRNAVGEGYPVILPLYGRGLNPYFSGEGPLYHMLVVRGYTAHGQLITNDPGTKRGKDYVYNGAYLVDRIHDWNEGDVINGRKVMIIVKE